MVKPGWLVHKVLDARNYFWYLLSSWMIHPVEEDGPVGTTTPVRGTTTPATTSKQKRSYRALFGRWAPARSSNKNKSKSRGQGGEGGHQSGPEEYHYRAAEENFSTPAGPPPRRRSLPFPWRRRSSTRFRNDEVQQISREDGYCADAPSDDESDTSQSSPKRRHDPNRPIHGTNEDEDGTTIAASRTGFEEESTAAALRRRGRSQRERLSSMMTPATGPRRVLSNVVLSANSGNHPTMDSHLRNRRTSSTTRRVQGRHRRETYANRRVVEM